MVKAVQGYLLTCDVPLKEYIHALNEAQPPAERFVVEEVDDTHVVITLQSVELVRQKVKEWQDSVHFEPKKDA